MPKLPVLSGEELIRLLFKAGFHKVRQKGSHVDKVSVFFQVDD